MNRRILTRKKYYSVLVCLCLTLFLSGCNNEPDQVFNTRGEAENYASANPDMRSKTYFTQADGSKKSLSSWTSDQWLLERQKEIDERQAKLEKLRAEKKATPAETMLYEDKGDKTIVELFTNGNPLMVLNGGSLTKVSFDKPVHIKELVTYHWNDGKGKSPVGTIEIIDSSGKSLGSWSGTGSDGQGGVVNANWTFYPDISLPAGGYTIKDSDPTTWSQNSGTTGMGMCWIKGYFE